VKKKLISFRCGETIKSLKEALLPDTFGSIIGFGCLHDVETVRDFIHEELLVALDLISAKKDSKQSMSLLLGAGLMSKYAKSLRVPDWVQVLVKLKARLPDAAWQIVLNHLNIGRSRVSFEFY